MGKNMINRRTVSLAVIAVLLYAFAGCARGDAFSVGPITADAGDIASGVLVVPDLEDEGAEIPVTVVHGSRPGPVLALIAGIHGYEYAPIVALQRVRSAIDADALGGTLILVHIANPASFYGRTIYYNPIDGQNMNRVFPGDPAGSHSERVAHALTTAVIEQADFVVDMHAGDGNEALRPYIYMPQTGESDLDAGARRLALAFGLDHIVVDRRPLGKPDESLYVDHTAISRGIPGITTETGQLGLTDSHWVDMAEQGVWNLLVELEMMAGKKRDEAPVVWLEDYQVITSPAKGLFRAEVLDGYAVAEHGRLGTLVDAFGDEIAVIRAPFAGVVNYVLGTPPVSEGEPLAMVSRIASE